MKIVERYVLRRASLLFGAALFWTIAIVWTVQVVGRLNLVTDSGQSAATFLELATMLLPSIIPIVIPFALAIAAAQTLTVMNQDSEMVVFSAAGLSRKTVIRPILILAAAASVAIFLIDNFIDPYARERLRTIVANSRADLISTVVQEGTFEQVDAGLYVQIGRRLPDGRLGQIFVADSRQETIDLIYYAKTGRSVSADDRQLLLMEDGEVQRRQANGDVSVIRFTSYAVDLSQFAASTGEIILYPKDRTLGFLINPDPNDRIYKALPRQFRAEFHRRLTEWVLPIVFALIALAVAGDARSHREARMPPMLTAMIIAVFVRWEVFFVGGKAQTDAAYIPAMYGVPIIATLVCVWFIRSNRTMELPASWSDRMSSLYAKLSDRVGDAILRLRGYRRSTEGAGR